MKKESIGALFILGGIAMIGFIWFKRNKPNLASSQLASLTAQSNNLATSADTIDKPFEYSQDAINNNGSNPYSHGLFEPNYTNMTPQQIKALGDAVNQACPSCAGLANLGTGQIAQNLQNSSASLNQLGSLNLSNVDWSNIKIK